MEGEVFVKTVVPKPDGVEKKWYVVDGQDVVLGRLASQVATILRGKHKPEFSPHLDFGDHVIVVNAEKIKITGNKASNKEYTSYTGYPGGIKRSVLGKRFQEKPERIIHQAVKGMLPKNRLGRKLIKKLRVYRGADHPHEAQKPVELPDHLRRI